MALSLVRQAETAEDDAAALQTFVDGIGAQAVSEDVGACLQTLIEVAAALRDVDEYLSAEYNSSFEVPWRMNADITLILRSVMKTHQELDIRLFQETRLTRYGGRPPYRLLWEELEAGMRTQGAPMFSRLEMYSTFLQAILDEIKRRPINSQRMDSMRSRLTVLLTQQDPSALPFDPRAVQQGLWRAPMAATPRPQMHPHTYTYPTFASPSALPPRFDIPPPVPEMHSPTFSSASEQTWSSFSSGSSPPNAPAVHWARLVSDRVRTCPTTRFRDPGTPTRCYGRPDSSAREMLQHDHFMEIFRYTFADSQIFGRFFWRPMDHRARLLMTRRNSERRTVHYCIPLTALRLVRRCSRLSLNRIDPVSRRYAVWANLYFPSYEYQVLFYCTFLSLKRQDHEPSLLSVDDYFAGETVQFSGEIEDDHFLHWLRIYKCTDSSGVRLEASARRGPLAGTPIWTAFITEFLGSRRWIRRIASGVIELDLLRPFVFCDGYIPPRVHGRFRLTFTTASDADQFVSSFNQL